MKPKGGKRIGYDAFEAALERVAMKKGLSTHEVAAIIVAAGGPKSSGTQAEACRFYDGKPSQPPPGSSGLDYLCQGWLPVFAAVCTT